MESALEERRQRARDLLSAGEVTTTQDFHDAAFVFRHGQEADDHLLAHILAVEAVTKGDASSKWISAATLDSYLQVTGRPQVFGTQYLDRSISLIDTTSEESQHSEQQPEASRIERAGTTR